MKKFILFSITLIFSVLLSAYGMYYYIDPDTCKKNNASLGKKNASLDQQIKNDENRKKCKYQAYGWTPADLATFTSGTTEEKRCNTDLKKYWKGSAVDDPRYPGCGTAYCCEEVCTIEEIKDRIL